MANKRIIAVVTGTRAEFGLLRSVMHSIRSHPRLQLRTVVAGAHWVTGTWRDVRDGSNDEPGFQIDAKVTMQRRGQVGRGADVQALARGVAGFGGVFGRMKPDFVVVLGDRVEAFAAASAASVGGFRVAHIHGGDRAEGVADEAMRHAISKLAHLHFPATAMSRRRLVKMGEAKERVINVGSPAIDVLRHSPTAPAPLTLIIVMQHPVGGSDARERGWMNATLRATWTAYEHLAMHMPMLVMSPNRDPGSRGIRAAIDAFFRAYRRRFTAISFAEHIEHLPRAQFLARLSCAGVIVGNSSAGLIEAAGLRVPCVNIGPRQVGREKPANVIDCEYGEASVSRAIEQAFKLDLRRMRHPYGDGRAGERIAKILATVDLNAVSVRKRNVY